MKVFTLIINENTNHYAVLDSALYFQQKAGVHFLLLVEESYREHIDRILIDSFRGNGLPKHEKATVAAVDVLTKLNIKKIHYFTKENEIERIYQFSKFSDLVIINRKIFKEILNLNEINKKHTIACPVFFSECSPKNDKSIVLLSSEAAKMVTQFLPFIDHKNEIVLFSDGGIDPFEEKCLISYIQAYTPKVGLAHLSVSAITMIANFIGNNALIAASFGKDNRWEKAVYALIEDSRFNQASFLISF